MTTADQMARNLDGARFVDYRESEGVVFAWHGGHGVHVYSVHDAEEIHYFNVGSFEVSHATRSEVKQGIEDTLEAWQEEREPLTTAVQ